MGQDESRIDPSQVPGYNPTVKTRKPRQYQVVPKQATATTAGALLSSSAQQIEDPFFRFADVTDHIRPIVETEPRNAKEELEDSSAGVSDLQKLLAELGVKKDAEEDEDANKHHSFGTSKTSHSESSDDEEDDDRGVFHHELKEKAQAKVSVFSADAHLISAQGDCTLGETLIFKDLSTWASQYPVYKIEWFIGNEIGTQVTFQAIPAEEGRTFKLPPEAVGRYIQVVATRRVEHQLRRTYGEEVEGGVFDPHVAKARHVETGSERIFTDVKSFTVVGPVMIPDAWSYTLMTALSEGAFSCPIKLRDEAIQRDESNQEVLSEKALAKIPGSITVTFKRIELTYTAQDCQQRQLGETSLFSFEWLRRLIGLETGAPVHTSSNEMLNRMPTGAVAVHLKLKSTHVRPGRSQRTIVLANQRETKRVGSLNPQDLIRFDVDPLIGRDLCLYALLLFQAASRYKDNSLESWNQSLLNGEVNRVKELLQRYLEDIVGVVKEDAPVYEEYPTDPWSG